MSNLNKVTKKMFCLIVVLISFSYRKNEAILLNLIDEAGIELFEGNNLTEISILEKEFVVSFDYKSDQDQQVLSPVTSYNIIYVTVNSEENAYNDGNPILSVSYSSNGVLEIKVILNGNFYSFSYIQPLEISQWLNIEICQILIDGNYNYKIKLNGSIVFTNISNQLQSYKNVITYASNPWNSTQGFIKNFFVVNGISSSWLDQWSDWSSCNTSHGYGFMNRTRHFYASESSIWSFVEDLPYVIECYIYKDACQMINNVIEDISTPLEKSKNITEMPILNPEFLVSFDFIPYSFNSNFSSIIQFIIDDVTTGYPGVWLNDLGVLLILALHNGTNFIFRTDFALPLNQWSKIEISQIFINGSYVYKIKVNDTYVASEINTQVRSFKNVVLYASNPWNVSQNGSIKNVFIVNNQAIISSTLLQWSIWSSCNISNGYGFYNRTRYLDKKCFTEFKECYAYKDTCQMVIYVIEDTTTLLKKAKNITEMPILDTEFLISFDLIPYSFNSNLSNVIHFIVDSDNVTTGVWLDGLGVLKVSTLINDTNFIFHTNTTLSLNQWSKIEISQIFINGSYAFKIKVNDTYVASGINTQVRSFKNVVLYASNPWNVSQNGSIKNVFVANNQSVLSSSLLQWSNWSSCNTSSGYGFNNRTRYLGNACHTELKECYVYKDTCKMVNYIINDIPAPLQKGKYITTMPILDTEFLISFDFIPYSFNNSLSSIIHFTNDSIKNGYLGVWLDNLGVLQVSALINGADFIFRYNALPLNQWSKIEISQILLNGSYLYGISVNNTYVLSKINTQVQSFKNVIIYASNPWNVSQNGSIKNLYVANNQAVLSSSLLQWSSWSKCNTSSGYGFINRTRYLGKECYTDLKECYVYKDSCQMINYVIEDIPTPLENAKNITEMPILDTEFLISFDLIPYSFNSNLSNVIHFIVDSDNVTTGVWLDGLGVLKVSTLINDTNFIFYTNTTLPLNQWSKIEISQIFINGSYAFKIKVNDTYVASGINTQVRSFKNVVLYASNPWNVSQNGSIKNVFVANNQAVLSSSLLQWSNWSSCNTSNGYGFTNRTRYLGGKCYTEQKQCYVYKAPLWNVFNTVSMQGNLTLLNLQIYPTFIKPSNVKLEFEYFLPPFFMFTSDGVIQGFVRTQANQIKYSFNGNFTYLDSFNYNFTATYNNSLCPISGVFILEIPLMLSLHVETEKRERIVRTFKKQIRCFNNPKIPVSPNQQFLEESYGRGIYWDEYNNHIYVCMSQHYPSTKPVCYFSDDEGYLWTAMDIRVGSVLGCHSATKKLYAVHRNRKMYLMFHNYYKKWLAITNQQFLNNVFNQLNSTFVKNLEGDNEQIYTLGPYQWLGNAEGLFFRKLEGDSWIQRVKWTL
ncbi:uncharacterized protein LOC105848714 isoform X3 [Hydra vulgaris]|uniref:uncharacterized protein LOC105848714 isoform X3 n=1 Tax=Hydra vulgaris TaxID=6087 RepID=UPI0032EA772E